MNVPEPSYDDISRQAEELWRSRGCPQDRDEEIWLEAERSLKQRDAGDSPRIPDLTERGSRDASDPLSSGAEQAAKRNQPRSDSTRGGSMPREASRAARTAGDGKIVRDQTRD